MHPPDLAYPQRNNAPDDERLPGRGRPRPRSTEHDAAGREPGPTDSSSADREFVDAAGNPRTWPAAPHSRNLWPFGIVAAFVVFIVGTVTLVLLSRLQRDDLVTADYYARELRYQDQIESAERTRHIRDQVQVTHDPTAQQIAITLPPQHASLRPTGTIQLYRPSAADQDREVPLDPDLTGHQALDARALESGVWRVRVHWSVNGEDYAVEERLVIPKQP